MPTEECGEFSRLLARLLLIASEMSGEPGNVQESVNPILEFVQGAMLDLEAAAGGNDSLDLESASREASARWGDWLALLEYSQADRPVHANSYFPQCSRSDEEWTDTQEPPTPSAEELQLLLATLQGARGAADDSRRCFPQPSTDSSDATEGAESISGLTATECDLAGDALELDEELLAAFLEDAARCLAAMEELAIAAPARSMRRRDRTSGLPRVAYVEGCVGERVLERYCGLPSRGGRDAPGIRRDPENRCRPAIHSVHGGRSTPPHRFAYRSSHGCHATARCKSTTSCR